jgi:NADH dehydrogenase (ubiquinone) 1 beta subcomplex subunit 3
MSGKSVGFQWQRYEAWRHHPLLQFRVRNAFPGLGIGIAAFLAFVAYDRSQPKDDHHH